MRAAAVSGRQANSGMDWVIRTGKQCINAETVQRTEHPFSGGDQTLDFSLQMCMATLNSATPLKSQKREWKFHVILKMFPLLFQIIIYN